MLPSRYIVGFTGHRSGHDEALVRPVLKKILADLRQRAEKAGGILDLYTSVAEGADTLCVEVANELGIAVHVVLPLPAEEFAKDFSTPDMWERSRALIAAAEKRPGRGSVRLAPGEASRPGCYFNQGMHMLEACDLVIALWDGKPARGLGGTRQVMEQAQAIGLPVVQIDAVSGEVIPPQKLDSCFAKDAIVSELAKMAAGQKANPAGEYKPDALQASLDQIANQEAGRFRPSLVRIIVLHGVAALLAAVVTFNVEQAHWFYQKRWVFTATELLLVTAALWMSVRLHQRHTQERWLRCRFACELVRGLRASVPLIDPLHPHISRHDPRWRRFAVSAGLCVLEHRNPAGAVSVRDEYLKARLGDDHEESQIRHYLSKRPAATRWWNFTGLVGTWSARLAPVFVLLSLLNKGSDMLQPGEGWHLEENFGGWLLVAFLPIALPLLAGSASAIRHALDAGRRSRRYPEMAARLAELKKWLPGMQTECSIRATITRSEEILLDELIEWQLAMRNTGH